MARETRVTARSWSGGGGPGRPCMGAYSLFANSHQSHTVSACAGRAMARAATAASRRYPRRMGLLRMEGAEGTRAEHVIYSSKTPYRTATIFVSAARKHALQRRDAEE